MSIDNETEFNLELMADLLSHKGRFLIKSEFDELDHIPLKERLKNLLCGRDALENENKRPKISPSPIVLPIKTEETQCLPQEILLGQSPACLAGEVKDGISSPEQSCAVADRVPERNAAAVSKEIFEGQSATCLEGEVKDGRFSSKQSCAFADRVPERNVDAVPKEIVLALPAACFAGEIKDGKSSKKHKRNSDRPLEGNAVVVLNVDAEVDSDTVMLCSENASTYQDEDLPRKCNAQETQSAILPEAKKDTPGLEKLDRYIHSQPEHSTLSIPTIEVKVERSDNDLMSPGNNGTIVELITVKTEIHDEPGTDELDHIPLKERQRMLLSRQSLGTVLQPHNSGSLEGACVEPSAYLGDDICHQTAAKVEEESHPVYKYPLISEFFRTSTFNFPNSGAGPSCRTPQNSLKASNIEDHILPVPSNLYGTQENDWTCSPHLTPTELKSPIGQEVLPGSPQNMVPSSLPSFLVKVKVETVENDLESLCRDGLGISSNNKMLAVKGEMGFSCEDELDHMPLRERRKLLISRKVSDLDGSRGLKCLQKALPPLRKCNPGVSENAKPRQRKRKKTATDSVETALEEDAPGLLQVLIDKGILVDEIKLYGGMESDEPLDSLYEEDSFEDLEAVISKLFAERASLFKFAPLRCGKGSKSSYCLACLISLVEQSRYLQFKKWPVEWGWCRDLQSFIFVFKRHNRIVLERPEYGYATYFFELVESLPIDWQIKRLVTAMKLPSCSRATIIENKSLLVGEDLTEGEARVLEEYGWILNTGLGSMLNYCDRVVHDRNNERDGSEWRSKIGKILLNGLNGGTVVLNSLPKKVMGYTNTPNSQIKLEL